MKSNSRNRARLVTLLLSTAFVLTSAAGAQAPRSKKAFTEEDIKEGPIPGSWTAGPRFDMAQVNDISTPVFVKGVNMISGDPETKYVGLMKIQGAEIENRGEHATRSIQLKWAVARREDTTKVLAEGVTPFFDVTIKPGESVSTDTPPVLFNRIAKPLMEDGQLRGEFDIVFGVNEVRFDDGSSWRSGFAVN